MIHSGIMHEGRRLALQYGDGDALTQFWKDSIHTYNARNKVKALVSQNKLSFQIFLSGNIGFKRTEKPQLMKGHMAKELPLIPSTMES